MKKQISYSNAASIIRTIASKRRPLSTEKVALEDAIDRACALTVYPSQDVPPYDSSAINGYAVRSRDTENASAENPIVFRVCETLAAGEAPPVVSYDDFTEAPFCVEVLAGGPFPVLPDEENSDAQIFDAVVKAEDTEVIVHKQNSKIKLIIIFAPVLPLQNKRLAGSDFTTEDIVIREGEQIQLSHVAALASAGYSQVPAYTNPKIGVITTGSGLHKRNQDPSIAPDHTETGIQSAEESTEMERETKLYHYNGPFLVAALRSWGFVAEYLGIFSDDSDSDFQDLLRSRLGNRNADTEGVSLSSSETGRFDVVVTTGGVSNGGDLGFIADAIVELGARIVFQGVQMRPGEESLFASFDLDNVGFFGLPGEPVAAMCCLRFLVLPYLLVLARRELERPLRLRLPIDADENRTRYSGNRGDSHRRPLREKEGFTTVGLGKMSVDTGGQFVLSEVAACSPSRVYPLLHENAWVIVKDRRLKRQHNHGETEQQLVNVFSLNTLN